MQANEGLTLVHFNNIPWGAPDIYISIKDEAYKLYSFYI